MDFAGLIDIPLWFILTVCCMILIYIYGTYPGTIWRSLGVPSPPSAPFMGHMFQLFDPTTGMRGSIDKWTKEYGKIFGIIFFRHPVLIVSDLDALKEIMVKDFNNYADRFLLANDYLWLPILQKGVFFNTGQDWKRIRRIMTPSFSSSKLRLLTRYINTTAQQLVDVLQNHAESGTHPEAKTVFSAYSLDALAGPAFGVELDSQNNVNGPFYQHAKGLVTIRRSFQLVMTAVGVFPFLGPFFKMLKFSFMNSNDIQFFEEQLTKLICDRKSNPDQFKDVDFLQFLINAEADSTEDLVGSKKLTSKEIVAQGIIFVIAGYETTSSSLQWLAYELSKNHEVQDKLRKEIDDVVGDEEEVGYDHCQNLKYMEAVINEALRMYPPIFSTSRLSEKDTELKGFRVPAKTGIMIPIYNIGRDPELFEDPDTFNPDRFMGDQNKPLSSIAFLPFGFGPRQCIGLRLALMQLKIALVHMMRAISILEATPKNVEIDDFTGFMIPRQPIRLILRKNKKM